MGDRKKKSQKKFEMRGDARTVADLLRDIADQLEGAAPAPDAGETAIGDFRKLKISLKREGDRVAFKLKSEYSVTASPEDDIFVDDDGDDDGEKYKTLKKRMKKRFKAMGESLAAGRVPDPDLVSGFLEDSEQMMTWPEYGESFFSEYEAACGTFRLAAEGGDPAAVKSAFDIIDRVKHACHDKFK
jgi:XXXCH domain-containing protein